MNGKTRPASAADVDRLQALSQDDGNFAALTRLLQLEADARRAPDPLALQFLIVNETRRLIPYRQSVLFLPGRDGRLHVEAVSSLPVLDRHAPMIQWLEGVGARLGVGAAQDEPHVVDSTAVGEELGADWHEYALPHVLWVPLRGPSGQPVGALWLTREATWGPAETVLLKRLAETYAHAWLALAQGAGSSRHGRPTVTLVGWVSVAAMLAAMFIPVRMSTLAPVEVVPREATVIAAPLDGVVARIDVEPNQVVHAGDLLLRFEDTSFRNDYEVAERTLAVAVADYQRAAQAAIGDEQTRSEVALLKAKVALAAAERDYARQVLERIDVRAPRDGVVLFRDKADWVGKPVHTGERVMELADPRQVRLRVSLPVKDAIELEEGDEVRAFLDVDPTHPVAGRVERIAYDAVPQAGDVLAYRVDAKLDAAVAALPRVGARGTAKLSGDQVPLGYLLFRRPLAWIRQHVGL